MLPEHMRLTRSFLGINRIWMGRAIYTWLILDQSFNPSNMQPLLGYVYYTMPQFFGSNETGCAALLYGRLQRDS